MSKKCSLHISEKYKALREGNELEMDQHLAAITDIKEKSISPTEFKKKVQAYIKQSSEESLLNAQNAALQLQVDVANNPKIFAPEFRGDYAEGVASLIRRTYAKGEGSNLSIESRKEIYSNKSRNMLNGALSPEERKLAFSKEAQADIYKAMVDPAADVTPQIKNIANAMRKVHDYLHNLKTDAGIPVGYIEGYVGNQRYIHNSKKVMDMSDAEWKEFTKQHLDFEETFKTLPESEIDGYLDDVRAGFKKRAADLEYANFDRLQEIVDIKSNTARKNLQPRKLIYKKESIPIVFSELSDKSAIEMLFNDIDRTAGDIAQWETLGPDGKLSIEKYKKQAIDKMISEGNEAGAKRLANGKLATGESLDALVAVMDGSIERSQSEHMSYKIIDGVKTVKMMALLGNTVTGALTDIANSIVQIRNATGKDIASSSIDVMKNTLDSYGSSIMGGPSKQRMADIVGVAIDHQLAGLQKMHGAQTRIEKGLAGVGRMYDALVPMGPQTAIHKSGAAVTMSQILHDYKDVAFDNLDAYAKQLLGQSSISKHDWDLVKYLGTEVDGFSGKVKMIDSALIKDIPDDIIDKAIAANKADSPTKAISNKRYRAELRTKIDAVYNDIYNRSVSAGGFKERAILTQGAKKHTLSRTVFDALGMLKSFSLRMYDIQKGVALSNPEINKLRGSAAYDKQKIAEMAMIMLAGGAVVDSLNEIKNNKTPKDPTKIKTWLDWGARGGFGGVAGDYMIAAIDRGGQATVKSLLGPMISQTLPDAIDLVPKAFGSGYQLATGKKAEKSFKKKDLASIINNLPGQNHFLIAPATSFIFANSYKEMVYPGHKDRLKKRMKEYNQSQLFE